MHATASGDNLQQKNGRVRDWLVRYPRAIPLGIFLAIAAITTVSIFAIESNERQTEMAQMRDTTRSVVSSLNHQVKDTSSHLRAGAALFASAETVTPELFAEFVGELQRDAEPQGAEGIGWAKLSDTVGGLETAASEQTAGPTATAIVTYFSPETPPDQSILGSNLSADPQSQIAMDEATRLKQPVASGKLAVGEDVGTTVSKFATFMPVFSGDSEGSAVRGFVYAPFDADTFLSTALSFEAEKGIAARLYDGSRDSENLIASHSAADASGKTVEQTIDVAGRTFTLVLEAPRVGFLTPMSAVVLLFGLAVAVLLFLLTRLLARQAAEDQTRLAFLEEQYSIRNALTRELNHRVKNTLANVLSILSLTRRRSSDIDEFATAFEGRITALSATHDLLTMSKWGTTPIAAVIEAELSHVSAVSDHAVAVEGPAVELAPNDALILGQAIHELATNAAKFGALSEAGGSVLVTWKLVEPHLAEVEWREEGGPLVGAMRKRGFGTELIQKIVAHELRQPVELDFEPGGVRCVLRVAVRSRSEFQIREGAGQAD